MRRPVVECTQRHPLELGGFQLLERHFCMFDMGLVVGEHELEDKMELWSYGGEVGVVVKVMVGPDADFNGLGMMLGVVVTVIGSCAGRVPGTGTWRFIVAEVGMMVASLVVGERWHPGIGQC